MRQSATPGIATKKLDILCRSKASERSLLVSSNFENRSRKEDPTVTLGREQTWSRTLNRLRKK